jgi:hypothetical protein
MVDDAVTTLAGALADGVRRSRRPTFDLVVDLLQCVHAYVNARASGNCDQRCGRRHRRRCGS